MTTSFTEEPQALAAWSRMTYKQKNKALFEQQKRLLDMFLTQGAIDQAQYDKSLHDLTAKFKSSVLD